jgi:phosphate/sulfate permease
VRRASGHPLGHTVHTVLGGFTGILWGGALAIFGKGLLAWIVALPVAALFAAFATFFVQRFHQ